MMVNVDSKIDKILNSNSQPMTEMASYSRSDSYGRSDNSRPTVPPVPKRRSSAQDCSYYEAYDFERSVLSYDITYIISNIFSGQKMVYTSSTDLSIQQRNAALVKQFKFIALLTIMAKVRTSSPTFQEFTLSIFIIKK